MFSTRFLIGYLIAMTLLFAVTVWLTRPRLRRLAGALASVAVFTAISAPIDMVGNRTGLWIYPGYENPPHPPLPAYLGQALEFVGLLALIGWRISRRWGGRGLIWMTAIFLPLGTCRDFSAAALMPSVIRFGPMPAALFADAAAWLLVVAVALGVSRLVAGPAANDPPRPTAST